jgi:hypothetical protein
MDCFSGFPPSFELVSSPAATFESLRDSSATVVLSSSSTVRREVEDPEELRVHPSALIQRLVYITQSHLLLLEVDSSNAPSFAPGRTRRLSAPRMALEVGCEEWLERRRSKFGRCHQSASASHIHNSPPPLRRGTPFGSAALAAAVRNCFHSEHDPPSYGKKFLEKKSKMNFTGGTKKSRTTARGTWR